MSFATDVLQGAGHSLDDQRTRCLELEVMCAFGDALADWWSAGCPDEPLQALVEFSPQLARDALVACQKACPDAFPGWCGGVRRDHVWERIDSRHAGNRYRECSACGAKAPFA